MFSLTIAFTKKLTIVCGSIALCGFLSQSPASAQEFPAPQKTTVKTIYHSKIPLSNEMKKSMKPGIRYTVGSVRESGWHKGLVSGNKNLGHYFWAPMDHMVQATSSKKTSAQARRIATKKKKFHYIKPVHVPLPKRPDARIQPKRAVAKKIRYVHDNSIQRTVAKLRQRDMQNVTAKLHNRSVSASYSFRKNRKDVNGRLISKKPEVAKVYAGSYGSSQASTNGYLTNKDAYGRIISD